MLELNPHCESNNLHRPLHAAEVRICRDECRLCVNVEGRAVTNVWRNHDGHVVPRQIRLKRSHQRAGRFPLSPSQ